ncbi:MAG: hypothetical protein ABFD84_16220, partial [Candidatus Polarisedimenticolia bacterium]
MRRLLALASAALVLAALPAEAGIFDWLKGKRPPIAVIYDAEYRGFAPVLRGVERPDLAADETGRLPSSRRDAERRARRRLRKADAPFAPAAPPKAPSKRWLRRHAVTTELLVLDPFGHPVAGARLYRYVDPSFRPVNQDEGGARVFDAWRYLPRPFPAGEARAFAAALDPFWRATSFDGPRERTPDIDERRNPWLRTRPAPPLEYVGATNESGLAQVSSGPFNVRDKEKFPRATAPEALRLGFVVVADGFLPATSEARLKKDGVFESRSVMLAPAPDHELFVSGAWRAAAALAAAPPPDDGTAAASDRAPAKDDARPQSDLPQGHAAQRNDAPAQSGNEAPGGEAAPSDAPARSGNEAPSGVAARDDGTTHDGDASRDGAEERRVGRALAALDDTFYLLAPDARAAARREAEARLWEIVAARSLGATQVRFLRRAAAATPDDPARAAALGLALAGPR